MRNRTDGAECPVGRALDIVGDRWSLMIVRDAFDGVRRFGDFQRGLNISKGILSTRLKMLEDSGIIEQVEPVRGGAYLEYSLTPKGRDLFLVIVGLRQWGEKHCFEADEPRSILVETSTGRQVGGLRLEDSAGRLLDDRSTVVRKPGVERDPP